MKFITDRHEIAEAINIKRTPVIRINIKDCMQGYENCYEGSRLLLSTPSKRYPDSYKKCTVKMYGDNGNEDKHDAPWTYTRIGLYPEMSCLTDSFGYSDVIEMAKWSEARCVKGGDEVLVIFDRGDVCFIRRMRIGNRVDPFVYPSAILHDIDEEV